MDKLFVEGGTPLHGSVSISGAKNSAVALLPAALLADATIKIENVPAISDVAALQQMLEAAGVFVHREGSRVTINPQGGRPAPLPASQVKQLRASYYFMGAMLGRFKQASLTLPGGCDLGPRPMDQHMKGFEALGAEVFTEKGTMHIRAQELTGARIYLDVVSVGATINIMLAAVKAKGRTVIENAAKEPEIIDVATLLSSMGADIKGAGTDMIRIEGQKVLSGCTHAIIPDRIEAGTYMIAAAAAGGEIMLEPVILEHVEPLAAKLEEMGVQVEFSGERLRVCASERLEPIDIQTLVHPGFPTDLQQPMTALLTKAEGTSVVTDTIYSARFKHIDELRRMNARVKLEGRSALIEGPVKLQPAAVQVTDLRAGAALVIAGLMADGTTEIVGIDDIDRGYEHIEKKLRALGARIWRAPLTAEEAQEVREY
ncbi:UDP-N-acetylglucosamine 1-carboxyvinyltransferase [Salsuginibacillus halophilus]|uniref:UDP-N-acetylglucosamine 1-carboxyvinyltransferase n=1 Tax=Salsuginibacillus halophilus TaxID=517424 RepID=A0A2P8HHX6_9BACI|nr:UDP-N-acetylglucosamine 1-carboxyvinyltransferase [Salsuginibacillus halophilus]PSL45818.1 UDP-N-acetylglucosamine 1-carboxyvinyltransferase [Salsuginibacillus halophilus]